MIGLKTYGWNYRLSDYLSIFRDDNADYNVKFNKF